MTLQGHEPTWGQSISGSRAMEWARNHPAVTAVALGVVGTAAVVPSVGWLWNQIPPDGSVDEDLKQQAVVAVGTVTESLVIIGAFALGLGLAGYVDRDQTHLDRNLTRSLQASNGSDCTRHTVELLNTLLQHALTDQDRADLK
jgi:hypothetical protein